MKNKKNIKRFIKALMILGFGALFVFVIVLSNMKQNDILCNKIVVDIQDENELQFILEADVLKCSNPRIRNQTEMM